MRGKQGMCMLAVALLLILSLDAAAQTPGEPDPRGDDGFLLVQSELNYLTAGDRRISIDIKESSPKDALQQIRKKAQLNVEVKGDLPKTPTLTVSFRDATVKEVLKWFAEKAGVVFAVVDRGEKLLVLPAPEEGAP